MDATLIPPAPAMRNGRPLVRFHVMAKPCGPVCNLRCDYCFYLHKLDLLSTDRAWRMSDEVLESFIRQYIQQQNSPEVLFSWQGGEPTLMGLDFFVRVVELQQKYAPPGVRIENDLQTNGTRLDHAWCAFLAKHRFLVGLSVDGPRALHDAYRRYPDGRGTFADVLQAARRLQKFKVPFNTLTCVHHGNADRPLDVYRFLTRELGATRLQFIPVVEPLDFRSTAPPRRSDPGVHHWSVEPDAWGRFLCKVFDDWFRRDVGKVGVYYFESALKQYLGGMADLCSLAPICGKALALEHNGDLYACDHYVYPEHRLGNILETPLADLCLSPRQEAFGYRKDSSLPASCRQCEYLWMCAGECPKNRFAKTARGEPGLNYLCAGWKTYFAHIASHLADLAAQARGR